jgi:uncharacterized protein (TIGR02001 family)
MNFSYTLETPIMNTMKSLLATAIAASALSVPAMADVEVAASVGIASAYLWRGQDLGNGSPAVSGDIVASSGGAYGGIWGSSGDDSLGNEYDLFAGYGTELGDVSVDISVWNYLYPDSGESQGTFGDLSEVILSVGAEFGAFSATYGTTSNDDSDDDYAHLDLGYSYNDNLSFTLSQVVDQDDNQGVDDDLNFVVSYSIPLGEM